ncbi:hypothetical protein GQ55_5G535000 [Panicum hallii var. hallii]|uniref:Uncharacterized protein n=1 Tax=Panicum hallii var. hallii TaxID=1504633 RepID=A0A2T7DT62_9POAL|nr:hypothetical protein GQ55_5G535000 [Panicum hallii var. hallii]
MPGKKEALEIIYTWNTGASVSPVGTNRAMQRGARRCRWPAASPRGRSPVGVDRGWEVRVRGGAVDRGNWGGARWRARPAGLGVAGDGEGVSLRVGSDSRSSMPGARVDAMSVRLRMLRVASRTTRV